ncbi:AAL171Wp [Eremothecium gossypii ATCC 10895]|uniref:AAL171Wp n=1 Tax=Eremothecium gossypii (strain ATCC 10895 / CBS 109.51 / FGSC 9923 / NRRL Y-1056) TaxID=284811 RepID=Q75F87_EREGS|nr:AAL171Wp [Eremothecium gossypii ATCC 10895]AAS50195.1 AAL171Wp [Eremothecium gossypii ATCC 10895]
MDDSAPSASSDGTMLPDISYAGTMEELGYSTNDLIASDAHYSTGSLVHKSIQELMQNLKISRNRRYFEPSLTGQEPEYIYWDNNFLQRSSGLSNQAVLSPLFEEPYEDHSGGGGGGGDGGGVEDEQDTVLQRLYNMVQVFLVRHGLSLDFAKVLKKYVALLHEGGSEPLQDQYILALQNELQQSYELSPIMDSILTAFLLRPENIPMKLALVEYRHQLQLVRKWFLSWRLKWNITTNLGVCESIWGNYLLKKYLYRWTEKYKLVAEYWEEDASNADELRLTASMFDTWAKQYSIRKTKEKMADNFHVVDYVERFRSRYMRMTECNDKAEVFHAHNLKTKFLARWRLAGRTKSVAPVFTVLTQRMTLAKVLQHFNSMNELNSFGCFAEKALTLRPLLIKWVSRLQRQDIQQRQLDAAELTFVKKKAYKIWRKQFHYRLSELHLQATLDNNLLEFIFNRVWSIRYTERKMLYQVLSDKNKLLMKKQFSAWRLTTSLKVKSETQRNSNVAKKALRALILGAKLQQHNKLTEVKLISSYLSVWRKRHTEEQNVRVVGKMLVQRYWEHEFKRKYLAFDDLNYITDKSYHSHLVKLMFSCWQQAYARKAVLYDKASLFQRLKAAQRLKKAVAKIDAVRFRETYYDDIVSNIYLKRYVDVWRQNASIRKDVRLEIILDNYECKNNVKLKRRFLRKMKERWSFYSNECVRVANRKNRRDMGKLLLSRIIGKMELRKLWLKQAGRLRSSMLLLNGFMYWLDRMDKIQQLYAVVQLKVEEKDVNLVVKCISKWNMKTLKFKRNEETGQMFRSRWNRALLRYVVTLWKDKTKKLANQRPLDVFRPYRNSISHDFMTPLKADKVTIPGSERVKKNKMERIKNRYRGARRAIPSPIKSSDILDSTTKRKLSKIGKIQTPLQNAYVDDPNTTPIPKLKLEQEGRRYSLRVRNIDFNRIPELDPFSRPDSRDRASTFIIDRPILPDDTFIVDESPTKMKAPRSPLS